MPPQLLRRFGLRVLLVLVMIGLGTTSVVAISTYHIRIHRVATGSMKPVLPIGDLVVTTRSPNQTLHRNDVVTFTHDGDETTTHVYGGVKSDGTLLTKGVANPTPDNFAVPPTASDVIGKVWFQVDIFTRTFWFGLRGIAFMVAIAIIALLYAVPTRPEKTEKDTSPV